MEATQIVTILVPIITVFVLVLGVGIGVFTVMKGKKSARSLDRWMHGAYALWTGGEDCGAWPQDRAVKSLANWYGATGPGPFWQVIADLRRGTTGNVAWDRVRALDLLRIAFAARFIDADQCATEGGKICCELQQHYRSWEELARAFETGMNQWQRGRGVTDPNELGRVQRNLPTLRSDIWPAIPWGARIASDE